MSPISKKNNNNKKTQRERPVYFRCNTPRTKKTGRIAGETKKFYCMRLAIDVFLLGNNSD